MPRDERKRQRDEEAEASRASSSDNEEAQGGSSEEEEPVDPNEIVDVEFEFFDPQENDFHGLKVLVGQLWEKGTVDLSALSDLIISMGALGTCVKVSGEPDPYGIVAVVNLAQHRAENCVRQMVDYIVERTPKWAADGHPLLKSDTKPVALVISERLINMPPQTSVAMLKAMHEQVQQASMSPPVEHYLFVMRTYRELAAERPEEVKGRRPGKAPKVATKPVESELLFFNDEEDMIRNRSWLQHHAPLKQSLTKYTLTDLQIKPERLFCMVKAADMPALLQELVDAYEVSTTAGDS